MIEMSPGEDSAVLTKAPPTDTPLRFLLVEDSAADAHLVRLYLKQGLPGPFVLQHVESLARAVELLGRDPFDLVLLDLTLPDSSGLETFRAVSARAANDAILILSGHEDGQLALDAVRGGAQNYILKGEFSPSTLAREVRFAMERNNRMQAERERDQARGQIQIARKLQKGLYPQSAPQINGFDIAGRAWAAEHACGDYFDFVPMKDDTLGIVVGDVSGHGLGPALKMVEARAALHAFSEHEDNLNHLIAGIHRIFCGGQKFDAPGLFLTLFLGRLHPERRLLQYASAGQAGFHLNANGEAKLLEATDFPIGLVDRMSSEASQEVPLNSGDVVVIPTDGFQEAGANIRDLFGIKRLLDVVRHHRERSADEIVRMGPPVGWTATILSSRRMTISSGRSCAEAVPGTSAPRRAKKRPKRE